MNDPYQTRQFFNMKHSELKQIIKEEIINILNESDYDQAMQNLAKKADINLSKPEGKNKFRVPGYGELPDLRKDIDYKQRIAVYLPSIDGNGTNALYSKEDVKNWTEQFKEKYGEAPKFEINGKEVKVTNPKFIEKQELYKKAVGSFGTQGD